MLVKEERYYCDYCKEEMSYEDYCKRAKLTLVLQLSDPEGGSDSEKAVEYMELCPRCYEKLGITNTDEHHKYLYSGSRIQDMLRCCKDKVINLFKCKIENNK